MRKVIIILTILSVLSVLFISGCGLYSKNVINTDESLVVETETKLEENKFYGKYMKNSLRPLAVMIDNDGNDSRPHAGLTEAYLVYEITVEGSATRLMALYFGDTKVEKIGPVRSARHYFLDYAMEHDAIYVHFGWSPQAESDIPSLGINNINGISEDGTTFWRERKYAGDYHSAYTSYEKLVKSLQNKNYRTKRQNAPLKFSKNIESIDGDICEEIIFPYAGFYTVTFKYNESTNLYERYLNGVLHPIQEKTKIEAQNIIIMSMQHTFTGDTSGRINISDVGKGEGYYITCGKSIPISWEKSSRQGDTIYRDMSGNEINLNPGQTWIQVISKSLDITMK